MVTINKASGTVTLASAATWNAASQNLTVTSGTVGCGGLCSQHWHPDSGGRGHAPASRASETITAGTVTLNAGSTVRYNGTAPSYTLKNYAYSNLTIDGGAATVFSLPRKPDQYQHA